MLQVSNGQIRLREQQLPWASRGWTEASDGRRRRLSVQQSSPPSSDDAHASYAADRKWKQQACHHQPAGLQQTDGTVAFHAGRSSVDHREMWMLWALRQLYVYSKPHVLLMTCFETYLKETMLAAGSVSRMPPCRMQQLFHIA